MRKFLLILIGCAAVTAPAVPANAALVISSDPTSNVTCSAGVCSATAADAVLNAGDLALALAHSSVNVESGSDAMDIDVTASLSWTTHHTLTLTADRSIAVSAAMVAESAGARVVLVTGSGGDLTFASGGHLDFWSTHSQLTINGQAYRLVADLPGLAASIAANRKAVYALAKSYDAGPDGAYAHAPVATAFEGKFEGLGHTISNLTVSTSDITTGLFATASGASLRDLALTNASITANIGAGGGYVSTLLGDGDSVTIAHVSADGSVSGYNAGGVVGRIHGNIDDASASVAVMGLSYGGGIVGGLTSGGGISHSRASGTISGGDAGGGLAGYAVGSITDSFATGNVTATEWGGGLIAYFEVGTIQDCYATGNVTNPTTSKYNFVGGLIGISNDTTITNTYALGNVLDAGGEGNVGGLVASQNGTIEYSYAAGTVTGGRKHHFGGFAGLAAYTLVGNVWDKTTGGAIPWRGIGTCMGYDCTTTVGLTTTQLQSGLPAGFDPSVWGSNPSINGGFPYLLALPPG